MDVSQAVAERISVRAFLPTPVSRDVIERVLEKARFAPSGGNVQPWNAVVVAGEPLRLLFEKVARTMVDGWTSGYSSYPENLPDPYMQRRRDCGAALYAAVGVARGDKEGRNAQTARNFIAFGAPCLIFCYMPRFMNPAQWEDLGMWAQSVMLLMQEEGLGTCAQGAWAHAGEIVREDIGIPADHQICCGIAVGYPDPDAPVNAFRTRRAPLEETVRFIGF